MLGELEFVQIVPLQQFLGLLLYLFSLQIITQAHTCIQTVCTYRHTVYTGTHTCTNCMYKQGHSLSKDKIVLPHAQCDCPNGWCEKVYATIQNTEVLFMCMYALVSDQKLCQSLALCIGTHIQTVCIGTHCTQIQMICTYVRTYMYRHTHIRTCNVAMVQVLHIVKATHNYVL